MSDEENPIVVTYEFCLPEHQADLWRVQNAWKMYNALLDVESFCRREVKHGSCEIRAKFAEEIQGLLCGVNLWDCE